MSDAVVITGVGRAGAEPALDPLPEAVRTRAVRAERITQLVLASGGAALAQAGLAALDGPARDRLGVVVGTAFGCGLTNAAYAERLIAAGPSAASPRLFAATVSNAAAGELSIAYRLGGPCITLTAGGAAGLIALAHAADLVRAGHADALLAVGADATGSELDGALVGAGLCAPADAAAALVVARAAAGRHVVGSVAGCASGFAADSVAAVVAEALAEAGVAADAVELAVGHGVAAVPALGGRRMTPAVAATSAAGGPLHLVQALAAARPGAVVVAVDACPSGHVAAVVARAGGPA
jgi:3-oxoacyl-[acyl-carrier-protein] synthase II